TLEGWYELMIRLDRQWRQAVAEQRTFTTPTRPQQTQWQHPAQPAQRDPNAMQVDRNCGPFRCYNCGQPSHMARACLNPRQQTHLMSAWNNGTDEERTELWRMMGGGVQAGGGMARIEEVPVAAPATIAAVAQPLTVPYNPPGFQFGQ
ncbi:hypothetical protein AMATHDRAFT_160450, partial [Amanita thiersii Skay4041]